MTAKRKTATEVKINRAFFWPVLLFAAMFTAAPAWQKMEAEQISVENTPVFYEQMERVFKEGDFEQCTYLAKVLLSNNHHDRIAYFFYILAEQALGMQSMSTHSYPEAMKHFGTLLLLVRTAEAYGVRDLFFYQTAAEITLRTGPRTNLLYLVGSMEKLWKELEQSKHSK